MKITGIIPARYASTRLPGKALEMIGDKTMIRHVYEGAAGSSSLQEVVVATDHQAIFDEVKSFGGEVVMTSVGHNSGTDRCLEALEKQQHEPAFVINIQGDEPFIQAEQIDLLASICNPDTEIATLIQRITSDDELFNPNVVKVINSADQNALYFSRATIPAHRDLPREKWLTSTEYFKHIGMYAYRTDILKKITRLPTGRLEKAESLEQLRWLEAGYSIKVHETTLPALGIDTPEDLEHARRLYVQKGIKN